MCVQGRGERAAGRAGAACAGRHEATCQRPAACSPPALLLRARTPRLCFPDPARCIEQVLGTYKPLVWEYSRLNITHNVMSKRKLNRLVTDQHVLGWDDPRLLTLAGLRRRGVTPQVRRGGDPRSKLPALCWLGAGWCRLPGVGQAAGGLPPLHHYRSPPPPPPPLTRPTPRLVLSSPVLSPPPQAINNFCKEVGVTRSEGEVHLHKLDHHIRSELDATSRRSLAVLRPLRLVIANLPDAHYEEVEAKVRARGGVCSGTGGGDVGRGCALGGAGAAAVGCSMRCCCSAGSSDLRAAHCQRCPACPAPMQYFPGRGEEGYRVPFTKVVYIEVGGLAGQLQGLLDRA